MVKRYERLLEGNIKMRPQFWVDGTSGDKDLEEVIAKRYQEIWQRFKSAGFERDFAKYLEEKFELFKKKQASYGPNNIAALGMRGIFVRIWNKVQRLRNLVWEGKANTIEDESIEDTFGDLAVYSIMAVVLMRGQWPAYNDEPLSEDVSIPLKKLRNELQEYLDEKQRELLWKQLRTEPNLPGVYKEGRQFRPEDLSE